jgi:hypothetical protein
VDVAQNSAAQTEDHRAMALHHGFECGFVTLDDELLQQRAIRLVGNRLGADAPK